MDDISDSDDAALVKYLNSRIFHRGRPDQRQETRTTRICQWVSALVPIDPTDGCGLDKIEPNIHNEPLPQVVSMLERRSGSFLCGGTNNTLARIYRALGFEALTLVIGNPSVGLSHLVVLVRTEPSPSSRIELHDAYFNYCLVDIEGKPVDYFDALRMLSTNQEPSVRISRLRTWKTELSKTVAGRVGTEYPPRRRLRAWYWQDPNWRNWLLTRQHQNLIHVFGYPQDAFGGESDALLCLVRSRLADLSDSC